MSEPAKLNSKTTEPNQAPETRYMLITPTAVMSDPGRQPK